MAKLVHGARKCVWSTNHPVIIVLPLRVSLLLWRANFHELDRINLGDTSLAHPAMCVHLERTSFERHITCYGIESRVVRIAYAT